MRVATLRLELLVNDCQSLREKRRRVRAIMVKLRRHFNVSIAVAASRLEARAVLDRVADAVSVHPRAELVRHAIHEV